jgi:hypothetical protein
MDKVRLVVYFLYTGVIEGWWYATIWILSIQLSNRIVRSWVVPRNVRGVKLHRLKSVITLLDKFAIFFANLSISSTNKLDGRYQANSAFAQSSRFFN